MMPQGRCRHCKKLVSLGPDGLIAYHDWPPLCRSVCHGAKRPPLDVEVGIGKAFRVGQQDWVDALIAQLLGAHARGGALGGIAAVGLQCGRPPLDAPTFQRPVLR